MSRLAYRKLVGSGGRIEHDDNDITAEHGYTFDIFVTSL